MADDQRAIYDRFSDTDKYSTEWVQITKEFLKLAFTDGHREVNCPCGRCENKRLLSKYEMFAHLAKKGFMLNYILWHQHGEVQPVIADESDGNDDVDRMNDMVADNARGYDLKSEDSLSKVHNFYSLLATSEEKVHDGTDMTVLQAVTHLLGFKSKYSFSNQCYNDIVKFVIDLIPVKHNMSKTYTSLRRLWSVSEWTMRRLMPAKKLHVVLKGAQGRHRMYAL
jgi:hypothetical protein